MTKHYGKMYGRLTNGMIHYVTNKKKATTAKNKSASRFVQFLGLKRSCIYFVPGIGRVKVQIKVSRCAI